MKLIWTETISKKRTIRNCCEPRLCSKTKFVNFLSQHLAIPEKIAILKPCSWILTNLTWKSFLIWYLIRVWWWHLAEARCLKFVSCCSCPRNYNDSVIHSVAVDRTPNFPFERRTLSTELLPPQTETVHALVYITKIWKRSCQPFELFCGWLI